MNKLNNLWIRLTLAILAIVGLSGLDLMATTPDASAITTTATSTFEAVGALVAAAVGFFIIVRIVKWVRK